MASYKVIQEVEAEDKIIGPFALKHIIYGMIAACIGVASWYIGSKTSYWLALPLSPFLLITAFISLSALLHLNQPGDVWLFSKLNFMFRPKKRLWQQIGGTYKPFIVAEKTVAAKTVPASKPASEVETTARDLSSILDSRGHSVKGEVMQPAAVAHASALDKEHDDRHLDLNRKYHELLNEHRGRRKKTIDYRIKQTLRARSHSLQPSPAETSEQSFKTPPSGHLSAKISEMTESGDLKVSTLEKLVKNLKSKEKLKQSKKRS